MKIEFECTSKNRNIVKKMFDIEAKPNLGKLFEIPGGGNLQYIQGFDDNISGVEIITFIVTSVTSVGLSVIANFIYDNLKKDKSVKVFIENKEITPEDFTPELIEKILEIHSAKK